MQRLTGSLLDWMSGVLDPAALVGLSDSARGDECYVEAAVFSDRQGVEFHARRRTSGDAVTSAQEQVAWVRELIAQEPDVDGDKPDVTGWLQRMCRVAARDLPAMGVGISILSEADDPMTVAASNEASALIEELQFTMGEGPCIDAYALRRPVLVPDLSAMAVTTWPGYAPAAQDHGVRSVFAFPLQLGAARVGALDMYRGSTGSLSPESFSRALTFAEVAMSGILDGLTGTALDDGDLFDAEGNRLEVYQAQGMVSVQLGVGTDEALARLRAFAFAHDRHLNDVARDVVARRVTLESDA